MLLITGQLKQNYGLFFHTHTDIYRHTQTYTDSQNAHAYKYKRIQIYIHTFAHSDTCTQVHEHKSILTTGTCIYTNLYLRTLAYTLHARQPTRIYNNISTLMCTAFYLPTYYLYISLSTHTLSGMHIRSVAILIKLFAFTQTVYLSCPNVCFKPQRMLMTFK